MDTLEINKILSGVLGAALVLMLLNWVSSEIYGTAEEGHYEEHHYAFEIELPESAEGEIEVVDAGPSIHEALQQFVGAEIGDNVFRPCAACHVVEDGNNGVGPHLYSVVGRDIASVADYAFSEALTSIEGAWTAEALSGFLESPRTWAPGTAMGYNGMRDVEDRAEMIAYLAQVSGQNIEDFILAVEEAPAEESAVEEAPAEEAPIEEAAAEDAAAEEVVAEEAATEDEAATEETATAMGSELPAAGDEGETVSAADPDLGPDVDAGADDVIVTDEAVTTAPSRAPEAEDANTIDPETSETIEETNAPADEEASNTEETTDQSAVAEASETTTIEADVNVVEAEADAATESVTEAAEAATEEAEAATEEAVADAGAAVAAIPAFMEGADAANGEGLFRACRACHVLDEGVNRQGPSLYAIVGKDIGAMDGFRYSSAMAEREGVWDYENLNGFLEAPRDWLPGTRMGYAGMRDQQGRADLIAYLETIGQ